MEFDLSPRIDSWQYLAGGLGLTLLLSLATVACSLVLGGAIGLARCYGPAWLRIPLVFYIDSMRAIPVLVVLVWTYFACPSSPASPCRPSGPPSSRSRCTSPRTWPRSSAPASPRSAPARPAPPSPSA